MSRISNLAYLGQEINHLFAKHGHNMALKLCKPLLIKYYHQNDYDWRQWQAEPFMVSTRQTDKHNSPSILSQPHLGGWSTTPTKQNSGGNLNERRGQYTKIKVPIHKLIPAPGVTLGYRYRSVGENTYPFDIYVITWQPGQKSPVHYHPVYGCSLLLLEGKLQEKLFVMDRDNNKLRANESRIINQGQTSYIDNMIGAHQICNPYDTTAVSLHIYSPGGALVRNIPYFTDTVNTEFLADQKWVERIHN